jgi:hypothetical protein
MEKERENITYVTAYYDLSRYETRPGDRNRTNYMIWAEFLFKLNLNIVFCVSHVDYFQIWSKRKEYGLLHKTFFILREFDELYYHNSKDELALYRKEHPILNSFMDKDTPSYILLTWNKIFFLEEIVKLNPFNSKYFGWIDFGVHHVARESPLPDKIDEYLVPDTDKIKILELRPIFQDEISDVHEYTKKFRHKIAGGLLTGHVDYLSQFFVLFRKHLYDLLSKRIYAHEETIFAFIYHYNRHIFQPFYGNYEQIVCNYKKIILLNDLIVTNITNNRMHGQNKNALTVAKKVYEDCYDVVPVKMKALIFDELLVNSYYYDQNEANKYLSLFLDTLEKDTALVEEFVNEKNRILNNIKFYKDNETALIRFNKLFP